MTTDLAVSAQPPADHAAHSRHAVAHPSRRLRRAAQRRTLQRTCHGGALVRCPTRWDVLRQWMVEPQRLRVSSATEAIRPGVLYAAALGSSQLRDAWEATGARELQQLVKTMLRPPPGWPNLLMAELELAADDARCPGVHARGRGFTPAEMLLRASCAPPTESGDGAAADLGSNPPFAMLGVAGHGSCLECAGPATALRAGRGAGRGALRLRRGGRPGSRPGGIWRGAAPRPDDHYRGVDHRHPAARDGITVSRTGRRALINDHQARAE